MTAAWDDPRISRGMPVQLAHRRELLNAGQKPLGWKLAFGGPAAMERLQISAPLVGFLMQSAAVPTGTTLSLENWKKPAAGPEIAVYLSKDLPAGSGRRTAIDAIAGIGPAIEVADVDHPSDDVEGTLARNIYQRHVILGRKDITRAGGILDGLTSRVLRNGSELAQVSGCASLQVLTGELIDIVRHVADLLAAFGETLQAGQIIITGSIIPPIWVATGDDIIFSLTPGDTISIRFASESRG
ncbi:MAG TPA: fumarylacetoacetate hydrolase family protein [Candidatus Acidoferrum sp.]|nr:fumarylacetoacetate hydrolase family protein [Candidatus Acidoferrum sp.]